MFEAGRNTDEATLACAGESDLAAAASVFTRGERQHMARKILAAYHLGVKVFDRVMAADYDRYRKKMPDKAAVRDVAWHFAVPPATAGRWMALGELLSSLPKIRAAFLDGDLSESRASLLAHAVIALDETQYGAAEDAALGYAAEASTNAVLAEQLDEMVIALDPDRAEQARHAYAARTQDVRFRKDLYGQVNISATLASSMPGPCRRVSVRWSRSSCAATISAQPVSNAPMPWLRSFMTAPPWTAPAAHLTALPRPTDHLHPKDPNQVNRNRRRPVTRTSPTTVWISMPTWTSSHPPSTSIPTHPNPTSRPSPNLAPSPSRRPRSRGCRCGWLSKWSPMP